MTPKVPTPDLQALPARRRVLIVDDHQLVREGLRMIIDETDDLCVCADVPDAPRGQLAVAELHPDVAVVDVSLNAGGDDGIAFVKWISAHHPTTRAVVASMHEERLYGERALRAGASGYVSKSTSAQEVIAAIRHACNGQVYFSHALVDAMLSHSNRGDPTGCSPIDRLSDRELQVFRGVGQGMSSKQIAASLNVSSSTVDTYRERLKFKLGISSSAELAFQATRWTFEHA